MFGGDIMIRTYQEKDVSDMTLEDVKNFIDREEITYSADYGFKISGQETLFIFSLN